MILSSGTTRRNPKGKKKEIRHNKRRIIIIKQHQEYFIKSKIIIDNLDNESAFKMKELPNYIVKYNNSINKGKKKNEYAYDKVYSISSEQVANNDLDCASLTSSYERCKGVVKFIHENVNGDGENYNFKKNIPLCSRHLKEMMMSDTNKRL